MLASSSTSDELIALKYQLYNALFLTLPFSPLHLHGDQLPLFSRHCQEGLEKGLSPQKIVSNFLNETLGLISEEEGDRVLFLFLQQVERQVVLFDAVEDAAFPVLTKAKSQELLKALKKQLLPGRSMRLVLTAHPTQFYPESLLGIITDLASAVQSNDAGAVRNLLLQLGRTSLHNAKRPTVEEEALTLLERYGKIFYDCYVAIRMEWMDCPDSAPQLELGFWPGGDRDGHPGVDVQCTLRVAQHLKAFVLNQYLIDVATLRRRLTFKGLIEKVNGLRQRLQATLDESSLAYTSSQELQNELKSLLEELDRDHGGLFRDSLVKLLTAVELFGFYFASLDIRQSSTVIAKAEKESTNHSPAERDLLDVLQAAAIIQKKGGEMACHRFVISHTREASDLKRALKLLHRCGGEELAQAIDIVPLFESIADLQSAPQIITTVLEDEHYRDHLCKRCHRMTVMVGFSDGSKDGGYFSCNWEIQRCKEALTKLAAKYDIEILFFDGRGGPAARGGGNTHRYYRSVAERIPLNCIQQTVQGQTIHSYYGSPAAARFNVLQLLTALTTYPSTDEREEEKRLLTLLSTKAHHHYLALRSDPDFIPALKLDTPLRYFKRLNIASRPPKRSDAGDLDLDSLRAIPFVGAWSLMKLNVPAYYGMGLAIADLAAQGEEENMRHLAQESLFFRTILENSAQALRKSYTPLTTYLENEERGAFWCRVREEASRSSQWILQLLDQNLLLENDPEIAQSIALREQIVLPLLTIQHAAMQALKEPQSRERLKIWDKMALKVIPASINASRNSA